MPIEISVSEFKAHCLEIINNLQFKQQPIIITKRDKAVAKLENIDSKPAASIFGMLKNKAKIKTDIVKSINEKWSAENE